MILLDAFYPGRYGGTGKVVDWAAVAGSLDQLGSAPLILAGGLDPQNVAQAIRTVRPHGVDAASGVESSPGVKDAARVCRFVTAARAALDEPE